MFRAIGTSPQEMISLLQPFGHRLPQDEAEFALLKESIKRIGRVLEGAPNNLGSSLRGNRQAPSGSYQVNESQPFFNVNVHNSDNPYAQSSTDPALPNQPWESTVVNEFGNNANRHEAGLPAYPTGAWTPLPPSQTTSTLPDQSRHSERCAHGPARPPCGRSHPLPCHRGEGTTSQLGRAATRTPHR